MFPLPLLPPDSFVPFLTKKLTKPELLWVNEDFMEFDLESYAYCVPDVDSQLFVTSQSKLFFADRYGGVGVGGNGGSARCGSDGKFQIKGIGRTPLVGVTSDYWHSHGAADLHEAANEVIWSEICAQVLPYGAARCVAVIATGQEINRKLGDACALSKRVLIIREAALRPAHFLRAVNFVPTYDFFKHHCRDDIRVRSAISLLRNYDGFQMAEFSAKYRSIYDVLIEIADRFACQIASARVRRIPHGALNCSNICLDGRYIDFGTMSSIPDFSNVIISGANPPLWEDHIKIKDTLRNLVKQICRYSGDGGSENLVFADELCEIFEFKLKYHLGFEFAALAGMPKSAIKKFNIENIYSYYDSIRLLIQAYGSSTIKLEDVNFSTSSIFHVPVILTKASECVCAKQVENILKPYIPDHDIRSKFCMAYWNLRLEFFTYVGQAEKANEYISIHAYRLNSSLPELFKKNLTSTMSTEISNFSDFVTTKIDRGLDILARSPEVARS